jgi:hypothetical protein
MVPRSAGRHQGIDRGSIEIKPQPPPVGEIVPTKALSVPGEASIVPAARVLLAGALGRVTGR